jgi:cell division protein FtsI/penicillin-binding protein 2
VLMDASNGQILVMASNPYFDPNQLEETWYSLITDKNSPLLNRAMLGKYRPGGVLSPLLLAATNIRGELPEDITNYDLQYGDLLLTCTSRPKENTWEAALAANCPGVLSYLGLQLDSAKLLEIFDTLGFYEAPAIRLESNPQKKPATLATPGAAAAGQGELRISPMQMALAACALSNHGQIPAPRFVLDVEDPQGGWDDYPPLGGPKTAFSQINADNIAQIFVHQYLPIWETSSLAYNADDQPLTWYIGGTLPYAEQPLVVVVLLESENLGLARTIGRAMLIYD